MKAKTAKEISLAYHVNEVLKELNPILDQIKSAASKGNFSICLEYEESHTFPKCLFLTLESLGYKIELKRRKEHGNNYFKVLTIKW